LENQKLIKELFFSVIVCNLQIGGGVTRSLAVSLTKIFLKKEKQRLGEKNEKQ